MGKDSERTVREIMRPAVTSVERTAHLAAAAYLMKHGNDSALVVVNNDDEMAPVAILTDTDIAHAVADERDLNSVRISDLVDRQPTTVAPDASLREAAELMVDNRFRHLPVVEAGKLVGMVDIADICRGLLKGS
jgi:CBS domain-containing protein